MSVFRELLAIKAFRESQAEAAVRYYAPPAERPALAVRWTAGLAELLKQVEPGSDHQLAIVRALAASVTTPAGAELLKAWLDGVEVPPGLSIDADLRWRGSSGARCWTRVGGCRWTRTCATAAGARTARRPVWARGWRGRTLARGCASWRGRLWTGRPTACT